MLQVELDHILPENDAYGRIREIIQHVEEEKEVYVITKDGRPAVAIISADQLVESKDMPEPAKAELPPLGLGGFALPASATQPVAIPPAAAVPLPTLPPIAVPAPSFVPPPPMPPSFNEPLPPLTGTEHVNQVPPAAVLPPLPPQIAAPAIPQFSPTLSTPNQAPFSFPKEDLDNASPLA